MTERHGGPTCGYRLGEGWIDDGTLALNRMLTRQPHGYQNAPAKLRLCFAAYQTSADGAFLRAARTWANQWKPYSCRIEIVTGPQHLLALFGDLETRARQQGAEYVAGALFLHASAGDDTTDGLQIAPYDSHKIETPAEHRVRESLIAQYRQTRVSPFAVNSSMVARMPRLPWAHGAQLEILACNSGIGTPSLAFSFAQQQKVKTIGQGGFASFSKREDRYESIDKDSEHVYLRAYFDGQNYAAGLGFHKHVLRQRGAPPGGVNRLVGLQGQPIPEIVEMPIQ